MTQTVYLAHLADSEGCGTIGDRLSVQATRAGAEMAFIVMFNGEFGDDMFEDQASMTADELSEMLSEEEGETVLMREMEVQP